MILMQKKNRKSARVDNATLHTRIDQVEQICQNNHLQVLEIIREQKLEDVTHRKIQDERLNRIHNQLGAVEQSSSSIISIGREMLQGILEVKDLVVSLSQAVVSRQISASNTQYMRSMDSTKELPVIVEDALGRLLEIPAQWLDTLGVECMYSLTLRFEDL